MKYMNERYLDIKPYTSEHIEKGIYLNANESSENIPQELMGFLKEMVSKIDFNRYPEMDSLSLRNALAKKYQASCDNFVCGVGSDELIDIILRATAENAVVLNLHPSFSMYSFFIKLNNGIEKRVPINEDFTFSIESIIQMIKSENPKIVLLCNPNNPTGSWFCNAELRKIISSSTALFVIDEAYGDFAPESAVELALEYKNVIVLKTFSKALRLAAIRTGYLVSSLDIVQMIMTIKPPYNLNTFSMQAAIYAIENYKIFQEVINKTIMERERMFKELIALGVSVYPSKANFLWLKLTDEQRSNIKQQGIIIREFLFNEEKYSRITIGTKSENDALLKAIKEV